MKFISSRQGALLRAVIPWLVAFFLLGVLFRKYPIGRLLEASRYINLPFFVSFTILYCLAMLIADCFCLARIFTRFGYPLSFTRILTARLASHIPMVMNYGVGQGALAYLLSQRDGVPFMKATGLVLFTTLTDLYITLTFAFIGSFFFHPSIAGFPLTPLARWLWIGATSGLVLLWFSRKLFSFHKVSRWPRAAELLHLLHAGKLSDFFKIVLMRLPMLLAVNTSLYFTALSFHAYIPFLQCLAYTPFVVLVAVLPVTPGGLGTSQAVTVVLFKDLLAPFVNPATVSASELLLFMSLVFAVSNYLFKTLTGLVFFKGFFIRRAVYSEEYPG